MNTYYQNNGQFASNNDIFEEYFFGGARPVSAWKKAADRVLAILSALLIFFTGARVRTVVRVCGATLSLVALVGVIGAMEHGSLGLFAGFVIGVLLIGLEFICLRRK